MKKILLVTALAAIASAAFAANNPATATFDVKITVLKACSVVAGTGSDISFGSQDASATNLESSNTISVTCSKKTPYNIGLTPKSNSATGAGAMVPADTVANPDTVAYQLRQATGSTAAAWGNTVGTNTVGGTGDGTAKSHTVFATVPSANVTPDSYKDTVTVSVSY